MPDEDTNDGDYEIGALNMSVSNVNNVLSGAAGKSQDKSSAVAAQATQQATQDSGSSKQQQGAGPAARVTISGAARNRVAAQSATTSTEQTQSAHATSTAEKFLAALQGTSSASGQTSVADRTSQLQAGLGALQRTSQTNEAVLSHFAAA